jgi:hypothetical protein
MKTKPIQMYVAEELHEKFKVACKKKGETMTKVLLGKIHDVVRKAES